MVTGELVSIIVPAFNCEKYLHECLVSCETQTYKNLEIIVVNDGSSDNTLEVALSFKSDKIKVFDRPNGGAGSARNFGFEQSTGDYIVFLDADDFLHTDAIRRQMLLLNGNGASVALCNWMRVPVGVRGDLRLCCVKDATEFIVLTLISGLHTQTACWMYPRILIRGLRWSEKKEHPDDDAHFQAMVLAQNPKIVGNPEALIMYRDHQDERLSRKTTSLSIVNRFETLIEVEKALQRLTNDKTLIANCIASGIFRILYRIPKNDKVHFDYGVRMFLQYPGKPSISNGSFLFRGLARIFPVFALKMRLLIK